MIEYFNTEKNRKDGVFPQCVDCRIDFYSQNLDKVKKYNEQNREKAYILKTNEKQMLIFVQSVSVKQQIGFESS